MQDCAYIRILESLMMGIPCLQDDDTRYIYYISLQFIRMTLTFIPHKTALHNCWCVSVCDSSAHTHDTYFRELALVFTIYNVLFYASGFSVSRSSVSEV